MYLHTFLPEKELTDNTIQIPSTIEQGHFSSEAAKH